MSDLRKYDFDNRDLDHWSRTTDAEVVNALVITLYKFNIIDDGYRGSIEGTYFDRRYRAQLKSDRSTEEVRCDY